MLQKVVVNLDQLSVHTLSRCVHTLDQVELDSQHALRLALCGVSSVLPLKLGSSGILNPTSIMNYQSLSMKMSVV